MHDADIDQSLLGMTEPGWNDANHVEAVLLPQANRSGVGRYHKIELHRQEAAIASRLQGMLAHGGGHAFPARS